MTGKSQGIWYDWEKSGNLVWLGKVREFHSWSGKFCGLKFIFIKQCKIPCFYSCRLPQTCVYWCKFSCFVIITILTPNYNFDLLTTLVSGKNRVYFCCTLVELCTESSLDVSSVPWRDILSRILRLGLICSLLYS